MRTEAETAVLKALNESRVVSRLRLVTLTGQPDRNNRQLIADLVCSGIPIACGEGGYRLIETEKEYEEEMRRLRSYCMSLFRRLRGLRRARDMYSDGRLLQLELQL